MNVQFHTVTVVVVDFIDRDDKKRTEKTSRETKNTLLSNCQNTANTYKSTILQDNNHQAKFKLTQEKKESDSFNHK